MLQSIVATAGAVAVVLVCAYAILAGSWRERFSAVIYLTAYLIVMGFGIATPLYMLMADILCIPGFFIAGWKSRHSWPRWALAGQTIAVACDVVGLTGFMSRWIYLLIATTAGWGVLLSIFIGTIAYRVERRAQKQAAP